MLVAVAPISSRSSRVIASAPVSPNSIPPASGTATVSPVDGSWSSQTRIRSPFRTIAAAIGRIRPASATERAERDRVAQLLRRRDRVLPRRPRLAGEDVAGAGVEQDLPYASLVAPAPLEAE